MSKQNENIEMFKSKYGMVLKDSSHNNSVIMYHPERFILLIFLGDDERPTYQTRFSNTDDLQTFNDDFLYRISEIDSMEASKKAEYYELERTIGISLIANTNSDQIIDHPRVFQPIRLPAPGKAIVKEWSLERSHFFKEEKLYSGRNYHRETIGEIINEKTYEATYSLKNGIIGYDIEGIGFCWRPDFYKFWILNS